MQPAGVSPAPPRGRGRPVGADSAKTRSRILKAARQVINQRGYQAATFQAIAVEADVSRPSGSPMEPVVGMLQALIWGMGFCAGVIDRAADMAPMTRQLEQLFSRGLPSGPVAADSAYDTSGDTPRSVVEQP